MRLETKFICTARWVAAGLTLAFAAVPIVAAAADLSFIVTGRDGRGVDGVVVTAMPVDRAGSAPAHKPAVMDQRNLAFLPRVLVVAAGSSVEFPNNDSVSHQVYSFSAAKHFQLPLYKGEVHPPVAFKQAGLVVLGCNIHDAMVGYIYVTDAWYFGTTDAGGALQLRGLAVGDYQVVLWSPFIADPPESLIRSVHVDNNDQATMRVQLNTPLQSQPEPKPRRRDWEY